MMKEKFESWNVQLHLQHMCPAMESISIAVWGHGLFASWTSLLLIGPTAMSISGSQKPKKHLTLIDPLQSWQ